MQCEPSAKHVRLSECSCFVDSESIRCGEAWKVIYQQVADRVNAVAQQVRQQQSHAQRVISDTVTITSPSRHTDRESEVKNTTSRNTSRASMYFALPAARQSDITTHVLRSAGSRGEADRPGSGKMIADGRSWNFDPSSVFAQVDAFVQRCRDLLEVLRTVPSTTLQVLINDLVTLRFVRGSCNSPDALRACQQTSELLCRPLAARVGPKSKKGLIMRRCCLAEGCTTQMFADVS